jgi:hypothetical protein
MNWTTAGPLVELTEACPVGVVVDGVEVCLVRLGGRCSRSTTNAATKRVTRASHSLGPACS